MATLKWYIKHVDLQTPDNGVAYFGPFSNEEIDERLNDWYADALSDSGNVDGVRMQDRRVAKIYINTREYWMEQLKEMEDDA